MVNPQYFIETLILDNQAMKQELEIKQNIDPSDERTRMHLEIIKKQN